MVEICLIGQRAIIGDIEAVCGLCKHTHNITCIEPVHTYEMEMRSFHKLVMRRHPQTVKMIRAMVAFKIQNRWERIRNEKVIADAKRYESSHPAGVESRLRPINSKLPRFLDEQREGIGRDDTSVSPARGRRGIQSSSSQRMSSKERQKRHHEATTKSTRGQGRQRSRSEGDTELRSSELTKLPSIKQKSFTSPKTYYEITKEEQKVRETAPSTLDLIYRQFGAVKKMKAGRQYSEDDYKKLNA
ncbi:uncharacterized protein LOC121417913 [Lytechinus variegatus]|uniref:uncharacterized protein LOC121417913 n=1 Tax=Lytechinus variegatus TaxID=7654 RepID=UPI001BB12B58|nr:uncharacterized protein LOC121417913 [Lytechinus variegatus]